MTQIRLAAIAKKLPFLIFLCLMLLFPTATLSGASSGLLLWFQTILPVLLPFIILSGLIIRLGLISPITRILYPVLKHLLPVSQAGCYPVFLGFLSGLPMGAKTVADLMEQGKLTLQEGTYLAPLCNNASPMFLLNYVAAVKLGAPKLGIPLCGILYLSAILSSGLASRSESKFKKERKAALTAASLSEYSHSGAKQSELPMPAPSLSVEIDRAILDGFTVITKIGGYVILFSILSAYLAMLPVSGSFRAILSCILEITTGLDQLRQTVLTQNIKFLLAVIFTAFGGLSGLAQTQSVFGTSGLTLTSYLKAKLLNAAIAALLGVLFVFVFLH